MVRNTLMILCVRVCVGGGGYSAQIIVPANQITPAGSKKNDIYIGSVSAAHNVAAPNHWIAMVRTLHKYLYPILCTHR